MHSHRYRTRRWVAATVVAVAALFSTTFSANAATSGPSDDPSVAQQNPSWGTALPPANASTSMAYDLIVEDNDKGYTPRSGECSKEIHARYWTYGPDGKVYPTWHPPRDPSGCAFGHEHGDDPRQSVLFNEVGFPAFGYTSEQMMLQMPETSHRHEDHVGHKVLIGNNTRIIEGDIGDFFPPQGNTLATCNFLLKFHQGTHSPDAFTNNNHELIYSHDCTPANGGQVQKIRFSALIPSGRPGGFNMTDCPGPFGSSYTNAGPASPPDQPGETATLGRLITDYRCIQAIKDGVLRYDPISGRMVPLDSNQLHEFWFTSATVNGGGVNFNLQSLFYSLTPSRYYDPSKPDNLGRQVELCSDPEIIGIPCDQVRAMGGNIAWDDPRSPFKGALRDMRPGMIRLSGAGSGTTVYTDSYGQNVSTTPFEGSIEQYFQGDDVSNWYLRGATKDWAANPADQIHAPN